MQPVIIAPCLYIVLAHQIKRPYKLHSLKIGAVKLRHHSLYLRPVQHTHKYCFYNVVVMMTERYFITAETFCVIIKISPAHTRAQITGRFFHIINRFENIGFKYFYGYVKIFGVFFYNTAVFRIISGVHNNVLNLKINLAVALKLFKQLCH